MESYIAGPGRDSVRSRMVTSFDLPTLTVNTDDGYDPPLVDVAKWVIERTHSQADG